MTSPWSIDQGKMIDQILIPKSQFGSDDAWVVIDSLSQFARRAKQEGGFSDAEIPEELLWNSQVTAVWAQISRNGIAGYIGNSIVSERGDPVRLERNREAAKQGFSVAGAAENLEIFCGIWTAYDMFTDDFVEAYDRCQFYKNSTTQALEERWFALDENAFLGERVAWIRGLSNLQPVDDSFYEADIVRLWDRNPLRDVRLQELQRAQDAQRQEIARIEHQQAAAWSKIKSRAAQGRKSGGLVSAVRAFWKN